MKRAPSFFRFTSRLFRKAAAVLTAGLVTVLASSAGAALLLTEIQSDQATSSRNDYWELTNTGSAAVSIGGWKWDDDSRDRNDPAAVTIPAGTSIAPGESIIFTPLAASTFRSWWNLSGSVQVIVGGPGLGQNDGIALFNSSGTEVFFFSYASGGFTRSNGSNAAGGHAGASGGGAATRALILDPTFGSSSPRYTAATAGTFGAVASQGSSSDVGSPGYSGLTIPVTLTVSVTPASFGENAGSSAATGTVTRSGSTTNALVVNLSSNDTSEATVPASVTIAAGSASTNFDVSAVEDSTADGSQTVTITASASGVTSGTFNVTVTDHGDAAPATLILTELNSNPTAAGANDFWELTNYGDATIDLSNWKWDDNSRSAGDAEAVTIPAGTSIAAGESIIFTAVSASNFRAWWNISSAVKVISTGAAPGLGGGDGVALFDSSGSEVFYFSYAAGGFTRSNGAASTNAHAGLSAGGTSASQSLVLDPAFGTSSPRYTAATVGKFRAFASATAAADIGSPGVSGLVREVDLSQYIRVGRYNLPEPTRTAAPSGNLLCQEASAVTYNWDTDTLFITGDGGKSITQVSKTGVLIDTMTLANGSSPQGTDFYDPEGITYIGNNQFVFSEERDRQLVLFTYAAGTTLSRGGAKTVKIGTFVDNTGTEGLSWDPQTGGFICLKEISPIGIFQTNVDFDAGTATNGSASTVNSTNLFNPALLNMIDVADVFALSNIPALNGRAQSGNLIVLSQESAKMVNVDRSGNILSSLTILTDAGDTLASPGMQHEGVTMDREGNLYIVNENAGGSADYPQLWVYAPSSVPNQAPSAVALRNAVTSLPENANTGTRLKVADIVVTDDSLGANTLTVTGADAAVFEVLAGALYLKAGTVLDYETKTSYSVTIQVDDTTLGSTPDATVDYTLALTDVEIETPSLPRIIISEFAPWSSGNSPVGADWFELTNTGSVPVDITGWKVDDNSNSFGSAIALSGITSIAPGESVVFMETSDLAAASAAFKSNWFGGNPPAGLQIGSYSGSGIGLSTDGDALNLYDSSGALQTRVTFGASPSGPFATFNNAAGLENTAVTTMSVVGTNGAFTAANSSSEIGSPGSVGKVFVSEVAPWSSGNGPVGADWFEVTNTTAHAVDITGWKMDDDSQSFGASTPLTGITTIAAGESVIFLETTDLAAKSALFKSTWFGGSPPANLQIGAFAGIGLSTGGDQVNLYNSGGILKATVIFGASSTGTFRSFDNTAGLNNATITALSVVGTNGAFAAANDASSVGSPGTAAVASPAQTLTVSVSPATFSESAANPAASGTVTRSGATTNALVVSLASNDTTEATVPATVTIPAGSASATFDVTAVDDTATDGGKTVTITASASGATDGTFDVTVTDDGDVSAPIKLLLTEVQSNQAAAGMNDYWELTNVGTSAVNLGNWKWTDSEGTFAGAAIIPAGTSIAAGESIILTSLSASSFRTWWGISNSVQVLTGSAPGLGQNDGIKLFDDGGTQVFSFTYAAGGFTRSSGSLAAGGHAGASGGGTATTALVIDPTFGTDTPRYTAATAGTFGAFASAANAGDIGSPGVAGLGGTAPTITLTVSVTAESFSESATNPAASGTVTRGGSTTHALVVNLSSSDTTEATVPATVTIEAGSASANFDVAAVNDTFPDGDKTATITASAADTTSGTFDVTVTDDGDVLNTHLLLTEVQSNQDADGVNDYWELTNFGETAADLAGYSWHDNGRSANAAAAWALPSGSSIAPGESVIFTVVDPAAFRTWWGLDSSVKVFQTAGAPGLGQNDGVSLFDNGGNELFFFNYSAGGFTREDGSSSTGAHAGPSAGGPAESVAAIWVPTSGTTTPRYTFATGSNYGTFQAATGADLGSPGRYRAPLLPGVISFGSELYTVNQGATTVALTLTRTDGTAPVSVTIQTDDGTASTVPPFAAAVAGVDYTDLTDEATTVNFAEGETTATVDVALIPKTSAATPNKRFVATLSGPSGGVLGATVQATVEILANDTTKPTLAILSPAAGASVSDAWPLLVKGTVGDAKGIDRLELSFNGGPAVPATLGAATNPAAIPFTSSFEPIDGANTIVATAYDQRGNSTMLTRTFNFTRRNLLTLSRIVPASAAGKPDLAGTFTLVSSPTTAATALAPATANVDPKTTKVVPGATVTVKINRKAGYGVSSWSGLPAGAVESGNAVTFTMPAEDTSIAVTLISNLLTLARVAPDGVSLDAAGTVTMIASPAAGASALSPVTANSNPRTSNIVPGTAIKLTATAKTGYVFSHWSGTPAGATVTGNVLAFTMSAEDVSGLTANFIANPFAGPPGGSNVFYGLVKADTGVTAGAATEGFVTGTLTPGSGLFSGKILIDGLSKAFTATFYGNGGALFTVGTAKQAELAFNGKVLTLEFSGGEIIAKVTQDGGLSSTGTAVRGIYSATNKVAGDLLNQKVPATLAAANKGLFTVGFPAKEQPAPVSTSTYPQGEGYATITLSDNGTLTLTGYLADGSTITGSSGLVEGDEAPVFVQVTTPGTPAATKGVVFAGTLAFDSSAADTDVSGTDFLWLRPAVTPVTTPAAAAAATNLYTDGWPNGIYVDAAGALYDKTLTVQAGLGIGAVDSANGNAELMFTDGKLTAPVTKTNFNINGNTVAKMPTTDASYTLALAAATGTFSGTFAPNWSQPNTAKPGYKGILIQKGANQGGFGFFLSNAKNDLDPESGGVTLGTRE